MKTKTVDIKFGYFKRGDDFASAIETAGGDVVEGLRCWAQQLSGFANELYALAAELDEVSVKAQADTHHASIEVPVEVANRLLEKDLVDPAED